MAVISSSRPSGPNHALQPTAASVPLAVPSSLRSSAAAEGERWASQNRVNVPRQERKWYG